MNKTPKKRPIVKILLWMAGGALAGALFSTLLHRGQTIDTLAETVFAVKRFCVEHVVPVQFFCAAALLLPAVLLYLSCKKQYAFAKEEELDPIDMKAGVGLLLATCHGILQFFIFNMFIEQMRSLSDRAERSYVLGELAVFLVLLGLSVLMESLYVYQTQKIDPRLKGDPMSLGFGKQFLESCDEAEKLAMYRAAYKSFTVNKYLYVFLLVVLMLANMEGNIGLLPSFLVTGLWLVQTVVYGVFSLREKAKQSEQ